MNDAPPIALEPPMPDADADRAARRRAACVESLLAFLAGALLMAFVASVGDPSNPGAPGNDSFYHVRMAERMPTIGIVHEFPWLRFAYFTREGHAFVSHHYGFHALLVPFVALGKALAGDALVGGQWATCVFLGLNLALFAAILRAGGIRARWFWLLMFLALPGDFYLRHGYIRAIGPALACIQLIVLLMFKGRPVLLAVAVAAFTHLYLGGVTFAPVVVGAFFLAGLVSDRSIRRAPWRLALFAAAGWIVGILLHPYLDGMLEFLRLQIFGTGLTPDIEVGGEWKPYDNVWWFVTRLAGVLLVLFGASAFGRLTFGVRLSARELTLLFLNVAFLLLTLKARRFIEYWPPFALLSAAYLANPVVIEALTRLDARRQRKSANVPRDLRWFLVAVGVMVCAVGAWRMIELARKFDVTPWYWLFVAAVLLTGAAAMARHRGLGPPTPRAFKAALTVAMMWAVLLLGSRFWLDLREKLVCGFDIPAIRDMMDFMDKASDEGEVIFTSDWDDFPVFFYHNARNDYVVGLDPKFTHARRPDLWERYVRITRGEAPVSTNVKQLDDEGQPTGGAVEVDYSDIRDHFHANYVITDRGHGKLARKLADKPQLAQLIYPCTTFGDCRDAPYLIFRILPKPVKPSDPIGTGKV